LLTNVYKKHSIHYFSHNHHQQYYSYTDAGNEHPLEQVLGLSIVWITLKIVSSLVGLHVVTILIHFILYAVS
jgi:hypothetical protein